MTRLDDPVAEATIAGCAVASRRGTALAVDHGVTCGHFHDLRLRRLFAAAIRCEATRYEDRIAEIAAAAGESAWLLEREVDDRPVAWDLNGWYAGRLLADARRRAAIRDAQDRLDRLLAGEAA